MAVGLIGLVSGRTVGKTERKERKVRSEGLGLNRDRSQEQGLSRMNKDILANQFHLSDQS